MGGPSVRTVEELFGGASRSMDLSHDADESHPPCLPAVDCAGPIFSIWTMCVQSASSGMCSATAPQPLKEARHNCLPSIAAGSSRAPRSCIHVAHVVETPQITSAVAIVIAIRSAGMIVTVAIGLSFHALSGSALLARSSCAQSLLVPAENV